MSQQDAMIAQRERIEELEEEVRQLRELLAPTVALPASLGLSQSARKVLGALLARSPRTVKKDALMHALYFNIDDAPEQKIIDVFIHKIRKALRPLGVEIGTDWGIGYFIDAKSAAALHGLIEGENR